MAEMTTSDIVPSVKSKTATKTQRKSFRIEEGLARLIKKEAEQRKRSEGFIAREALTEFFDRKAKAKKRRAAK